MFARPEFGIALIVILLVVVIGSVRVILDDIQSRLRTLWRIEAKLDLVLKLAGVEFDPYKNFPPEVTQALQQMMASEANSRGRKKERVRAIYLYRKATSVNVKDAREFIDEVERRAAA